MRRFLVLFIVEFGAAGLFAAPAATVAFKLTVSDLEGNELPGNLVAVGDDFRLNCFVQDLRGDDARGVFAGYLDVRYDNPGLFSLVTDGDRADPEVFRRAFTTGPEYPLGLTAQDGDRSPHDGPVADPNVLSEVGSFTDRFNFPAGTGGDRRLLWSVTFHADAAGEVTFTGVPADNFPWSWTLLLGDDGPPDVIDHGAPLTVTLSGGRTPRFVRGDADSDGGVGLTDAVQTLNFLFLGRPAPACLDSADTDNGGALQLTDAIVTLNYLFTGGSPPVPPGPGAPIYASADCGADTGVSLGCERIAATCS